MRLLRRLVTVPLVAALDVLILASAPVTLAIAALLCLPARSSLPLRTVALFLAYAAIELSLLPRLLGAGEQDWDALLREVLDRGHRAMRTTLDVTVVEQPGSVPVADLRGEGGVIVLARHCGPGDSLFIAWLLSVHHGLRLRVVLTALLRLQPSVDLAGDHLPLCFVGPGVFGRGRRRARECVEDVARSMTAGDALLLFPEGENYSRERWRRALGKLVASGAVRRVQRMRRNTYTLPPRLGGILAALTAAPDADVVFLAHSGFTDDGRDRPLWRLPIHRTLLVHTTRVAAADVPRHDDAALSSWLDAAWTDVDEWIGTTVENNRRAAGLDAATAG
ncbi:lysophospholipid acyltransferase family protein [Pseudonocardia ailaonensis]|uniref:Lysophospholipid acyltransferase family protein n=1 Tax=Pseudonocardia ailaonensis TaxID=367279 RepID=A0ABN2NCN4_9PSEU